GETWSEWYPVAEDHDMAEPDAGKRYAQPIPVSASTHAQYRVRADEDQIDAVALTFMDVTDLNHEAAPLETLGQDLSAAWRRITTPLVAEAAVNVAVRTRAQWGADAGLLRSPPWHVPWKKAIVHHTVTTTSYAEATAQIRSIYYFHSVTRRWGDIGYNFLVDKWGNVWQGRAGGDDSVGMHASGWNEGSLGVAILGDFSSVTPTSTMRDSVARVIAAKLGARGIQPMGADRFTHEELDRYGRWHEKTSSPPNVIGHRDAIDAVGASGAGTACPGNRLYSHLESIRRTAQALVSGSPVSVAEPIAEPPPKALQQLAVKWLSASTPSRIQGTAISVPVKIRNTGVLPWIKGVVNVGYHWYDPEGRIAVWDTGPRTTLPNDVDLGKEVSLKVVVHPPPGDGRYRLVYDLVWEGRSWFSKLGASTVSKRVTAGFDWAASYSAPAPLVLDPGQERTVEVTLKNTSSSTWKASGTPKLNLGAHVFGPNGAVVSWDGPRTPLPKDVAPGASITVPALVKAPAMPGIYSAKLDLVLEGVSWFSSRGTDPASTYLTVPTPTFGAKYVVKDVVARSTLQAAPGSRLTVPVTVTNTSSFTWVPGTVSLAYHVHDATGAVARWDGVRTMLASEVAPGATVTLDAALELPATAGDYVVRWDLVLEGVAWFSDRGVAPVTQGAVVSTD
ncbi:MAG TPA: N-acetylmuramoyl-L-alanine amidase, partial [Gemmatimonadaceae bacterium]|nr:N-acetylmuramoyl-L-alanine amidase [Gemmatimonadaceae bacterium]